MREAVAQSLDVSDLPTYAYGHRSLMWWGTVGIMLIEGTVFAIAIAAYFYIRTRVEYWPPSAASPNLFWSNLNTLILLLSLAPNQWAKKAAERPEVQKFVDAYFGAAALIREVGYVELTPQIYDLAKKHFADRKVGTAFGAGGSQVGMTLEKLLTREQ